MGLPLCNSSTCAIIRSLRCFPVACYVGSVTACTVPSSPHSKPSSMDLEYREDETPSDRPQLQTLFANRPIAIQQYYWNRNT